MAVTTARPVRSIKTIPGVGGQLMVAQQEPDSSVLAWYNFEVSRWEVNHTFINADVTCSGGNGNKQYRHVGNDWDFACEIPFDADKFLELVFQRIDGKNNGNSVHIKFKFGDSAFYDEDKDFQYYCPEVLLDKVVIIDDNTGEDVIRARVTGRGSALLEGYEGSTQKFGTS